MSSPYFFQNMVTLRKIFPLLAEEIEKAKDNEENLTIEETASGDPTLLIRLKEQAEGSSGIYVHSRRDPKREAERLIESAARESSSDETPALVLGFGLGYAALALAAKFPDRPIIIVEKRADVLRKTL
ncbi:MAG: hypothetical protein LBH43_09875, partial [Treponema sp.]|nr:hypothetical protein [Treponema sp.]